MAITSQQRGPNRRPRVASRPPTADSTPPWRRTHRAGELDASPGELLGGILGGPAGRIHELVGIGQVEREHAGGDQLFLVG